MPQGMGLAVAQSSPPQEGPPDVLPEGPRGDRAPISPNEQPRRARLPLQDALCFPDRQEPLEHAGQLRAHVDPADAVALRGIDPTISQCLLPAAPCSPHPQHVLRQVDVIGLQLGVSVW